MAQAGIPRADQVRNYSFEQLKAPNQVLTTPEQLAAQTAAAYQAGTYYITPTVKPTLYPTSSASVAAVMAPLTSKSLSPLALLKVPVQTSSWAARRVVGQGTTGGRAWEQIATGIGKTSTRVWL
jgi:hypothetical protein